MDRRKDLASKRQLSVIEEADDGDETSLNRSFQNKNDENMSEENVEKDQTTTDNSQAGSDQSHLMFSEQNWPRFHGLGSEMSVIVEEAGSSPEGTLTFPAKCKLESYPRAVSDLVCGRFQFEGISDNEDCQNANIPDSSRGDLDNLLVDRTGQCPRSELQFTENQLTGTGDRQKNRAGRQKKDKNTSTESIQEMFQVLIKSIDGGFPNNQTGPYQELQADDLVYSQSLMLLGQEKVEGQPVAVDNIISTFKERFSLPGGKHQPVRQKSRRTLELEKLAAAKNSQDLETVKSEISAEGTDSSGNIQKSPTFTELGFPPDISIDNDTYMSTFEYDPLVLCTLYNNGKYDVTNFSDFERPEKAACGSQHEILGADCRSVKGEVVTKDIIRSAVNLPCGAGQGQGEVTVNNLQPKTLSGKSHSGNGVIFPPGDFLSRCSEFKIAKVENLPDCDDKCSTETELKSCVVVKCADESCDTDLNTPGQSLDKSHVAWERGQNPVQETRTRCQTFDSPKIEDWTDLNSFWPRSDTDGIGLEENTVTPISGWDRFGSAANSWSSGSPDNHMTHDPSMTGIPGHEIHTGGSDTSDINEDQKYPENMACIDTGKVVRITISSDCGEEIVKGFDNNRSSNDDDDDDIDDGDNNAVDGVDNDDKAEIIYAKQLQIDIVADAAISPKSAVSSQLSSTSTINTGNSCCPLSSTTDSTSSSQSSMSSLLSVPGAAARLSSLLHVPKPPMLRHVSQPNMAAAAAHSARNICHPDSRDSNSNNNNNNNNNQGRESKSASKDFSSDLAKVKATAIRLKLTTRRPSYSAWLEENDPRQRKWPRCGQRPEVESVTGQTRGATYRPGRGSRGSNWYRERKTNIETSLAWLRKELQLMRTQDQSLARQLLTLYQDIHKVRLSFSCQEHRELLDEVQCDLEELYEFSSVLDLPMTCLLNSPLKHVGVTRLNISARRFSTC